MTTLRDILTDFAIEIIKQEHDKESAEPLEEIIDNYINLIIRRLIG